MTRSGVAAESEFAFIRRRLAPLAAGAPGALMLTDDAAVLTPEPGKQIVIAADMLVMGVHIDADAPLDLVARKALRTNLSDLAAMGARPTGYLLSVCWPRLVGDEARDRFVDGLAADQARFGVHLLGGDTTADSGALTVAITAIGEVPDGQAVKRSGARPGDVVAVTGTIGDACLGLALVQGRHAAAGEAARHLRARYYTPDPRIELAEPLRRYASAAIDVSDGLMADARHIAQASNVTLRIDLERMPLSTPVRSWFEREGGGAGAAGILAAAGDDYELVVTGPEADMRAFALACRESGVEATVIGEVVEGKGALETRFNGERFDPGSAGFTHF